MVDCLEDPDDTLKLKTLTLLHRMTKANNVEVGGIAAFTSQCKVAGFELDVASIGFSQCGHQRKRAGISKAGMLQ